MDAMLHLRLGQRDQARLDALAARLPGVKRSALARDLLGRALDDFEADPARLVRDGAPPSPLALGPTFGEVA